MFRKYHALIDTNVLVSALLKCQSVPGSVVELAMSGVLVPILHADIVAEYRTILSRSKFGFTEDIIADVIVSLEKAGIYVDAEAQDIEMPDPKDRVFYEVVTSARKECDTYLVTGNIKHFPDEPFIVTPRQMLDIMLDDFRLAEGLY